MANTQFPVDDVVDIVKSVIKEVIQIHDEEITSVAEGWERNIKKRILWNLSQLNKPLKYIVICSITQNIGGSLYEAGSCYWDNTTDGSCSIRWEHPLMHCVVTVYGLSI